MTRPDPPLGALRPHLVTGVVGLAGAAALAATGLPAGALVGATLATGALAATRSATPVHPRLRDGAFAVIGISLGAGIERGLLDALPAWSLSLTLLALCLATTVWAGAALLRRMIGAERGTAILASAPGTMSNAIAIAAEGRGDATTVLVIQLVRLQSLVVLAPPVALFLGAPAAGAGGGAAEPMGAAALVLLLAGAMALGRVAERAGVPAASMISGMVCSGGAHYAGLVEGAAPGWAVFLAFAVAGTALGARLSRLSWGALRRMLAASVALLGLSLALSLAFAGLAAGLTGLPLGQVWISYAPGAVEAMAAIGFALGYDPAYVALHHILRIVFLLAAVAWLLRQPG